MCVGGWVRAHAHADTRAIEYLFCVSYRFICWYRGRVQAWRVLSHWPEVTQLLGGHGRA